MAVVVSFLPFSLFFFLVFFLFLSFFRHDRPRGNIVLLYERVPKKRKLPKFRIARNATADFRVLTRSASVHTRNKRASFKTPLDVRGDVRD